jgi:hypothetical protein
MIRVATVRNPSRLTVSPSNPQAKGGTYVGGCGRPNTLEPAPTTVPVLSIVPIAVLAWSPNSVPTLSRPVSMRSPATLR